MSHKNKKTFNDWVRLHDEVLNLPTVNVPIPPVWPLQIRPLEEKQKENTMCKDISISVQTEASSQNNQDRDARRHLSWRLNAESNDASRKAEKFFGLEQDPPKNAEEAIQRIKDGKFILRKKKDYRGIYEDHDMCEGSHESDPLDRVIWLDPAKKRDPYGYRDWADKVRDPAWNEANDIIEVLSPEQGLKALAEFKTKVALS